MTLSDHPSYSSHLSLPCVQALAISPGVAIGPVRLMGQRLTEVSTVHIAAEQVEEELHRLRIALAAAIAELDALQIQVEETVGRDEADIFAAQQLMLEDPDLLEEVQALITDQHYSAASALQQVAGRQAEELASLDSDVLAARAADVRDVASRVIRHMSDTQQHSVTDFAGTHETPAILVAYDLTPSDTASLNPHTILGICTVVGGPTTHAAILARALEIPAIAGIDSSLFSQLHEGQHIAIDGSQGRLYLAPDGEQTRTLTAVMEQRQQEQHLRARNNRQWRDQPGMTADGVAVHIFANVGDNESALAAARNGAEGIGLLRTEFLFGGRPMFPDEQEQFESYVSLFRSFAGANPSGKTIIARTLDAGADKPFPALEPLIGLLNEANPALGLRGARIHLVHEALLRQQLRALLRAAAHTGIQLSIMFPMIATVEEVRRLRGVFHNVRDELHTTNISLPELIPVGIMVETPAAAVMADVLAREVDFFSIGANDLFQYTMAADRTNSRVASLFGLLEPAVWRLIGQIVQAGASHGKLVALCGELAADPRIGPLLAGLGVRELSMSPPAIPRVKAALHQHPMEYWQQLAHRLLEAETALEMQRIVETI